ncbi:MAG: SPOR domain-containing protein [Burkholderiaceae bacterium]
MSLGKRKKRRARSSGGTLLGVLIGLLVGLTIAVAAALFMSKSAVPFVDKVKRPAAPPAVSGEVGKSTELPDPNRAMQKGKPPPSDTAASANVPGAPPPSSTTPATPSATPAAPVPAAPGAAPSVATAPATSPATPVDPPADKSAFLLQAGAFKGQEDAEGMKAKLALIGFEARIVTAEVNGVTFYRVRVGPYGQIEDMNRARSRLAENGIEASVVRQR